MSKTLTKDRFLPPEDDYMNDEQQIFSACQRFKTANHGSY